MKNAKTPERFGWTEWTGLRKRDRKTGEEVALARTYVGPYLRVGEHGQIERVDPYWRTYAPGEVLPSPDTRAAPAPAVGLPEPPAAPSGGLLPSAPPVPPLPGEVPIPEGHVRLFHITPLRNLDSVREHGLTRQEARGESYGEPNQVWASAGLNSEQAKRVTEGGLMDSDFTVVEFHADPAKLDIGNGRKPEDMEARASDVTLYGDVPPGDIVAIHEPWHSAYRYLSDYRKEVVAGEYDFAGEDNANYARAIETIKQEEAGGLLPTGLKFKIQEFPESPGGGSYVEVRAADPNGYPIASLGAVRIRDRVEIRGIEVVEDLRKQGIATEMLNRLHEKYPDDKVYHSLLNDNSRAWFATLPPEWNTTTDFKALRMREELQGDTLQSRARAALERVPTEANVSEDEVPNWDNLSSSQPPTGEPGSVVLHDTPGGTGFFQRIANAYDDDGKLASTAQADIAKVPWGHMQPGEVRALYVATRPDARRKGHATKLYDALRESGLDIVPAVGQTGVSDEGSSFTRGYLGKLAEPEAPIEGGQVVHEEFGRGSVHGMGADSTNRISISVPGAGDQPVRAIELGPFTPKTDEVARIEWGRGRPSETPYVTGVWVAPKYRRTGVGTWLWQQARAADPTLTHAEPWQRTRSGKKFVAGLDAGGLLPTMDAEDWRIEHRPSEEGAHGYDLTENMPDDVYDHPEYYTSMNTGDPDMDQAGRESAAALREVRGKPEGWITIYRSSPEGTGIGPGDWVTPSPTYAKVAGRHPTDESKDMPVHSLRVRARDIRWAGDDLNEFGYFPEDDTPHLLVSGATKEDLAAKLDEYEIRYSGTNYGNLLIVGDPKKYGQEIAHLDFSVGADGGMNINSIYVDPEYRKKGIAVGMLAALHERFDRPLHHGSFISPQGAQLGFFMASHYPEWNKVWLGHDDRPRDPDTGRFPVVYWKPGDPITGEESTFSMPYESKTQRVQAAQRAVARGLKGAPPPPPPEPRQFATVKEAEDHVRERYGYADFTGMEDEDLPHLSAVIAEVDRIADEFPQVENGTLSDIAGTESPWRFQGIGTIDVAPPNVREGPGGMLDSEGNVRAWGATRNTKGGPRIWLATGEDFRQGTGTMGAIGFTFERTPEECIVHEMGHVMQSITPGSERQWSYTVDRVWPWTPKSKRGPKVSISKDIAVYADRSFEGFASLFAVMNIRGGLERLTPAARRRVIAAAVEMNEAAAARKKGAKVV